MDIKTILNRIEKQPSFVYGQSRFVVEDGGDLSIEVDIHPRANARPVCSRCWMRRPHYDTLDPRRFQYVPLWGILVFFVYAMRRVNCPRCGVVVEMVPWAEGKQTITTRYAWFLARWAKRMSWAEVARAFRTSWETVFRATEMAVEWGRRHMNLDGIRSIGVDEIAWKKGHRYLTVVYQIDEGARRLLWVGKERTTKTLLGFFRWFGKERSSQLAFVCSDMWKPYLKVLAKKAGQALHILDRFHIMQHMSKAIDEVRAGEAREARGTGREVLKGSRWWLLKRPENLKAHQAASLQELLRCNLKAVRAYLLKEEFQLFWEYRSPHWANVFMDYWTRRAMRSRIEPMKRVARMLRRHQPLILNWFRARGAISAGAVEGLNNKAKLSSRMAYGFRNPKVAEVALYHRLGDLPEPECAHRFC